MIKVYEHLRDERIQVYFIGQHEGRVEKPHVTLRDGGQVPNVSTNRLGQQIVDVIILVPVGSYVQLESFKEQVKAVMAKLDWSRKTGTETPPIVDDTKKAYTASIEYIIQKTL